MEKPQQGSALVVMFDVAPARPLRLDQHNNPEASAPKRRLR